MRVGGRAGSASDTHTTGVWDLVWGRTDDAVADLREAVQREPSNARALNDLAVALTEYAQRHDDPSALIDAFVAADSAVRVDSTLPRRGSRTPCCSSSCISQTDAIAAWNRYLQMDGSSGWAAEARERLAALKPREERWKQEQERLRSAVASVDSRLQVDRRRIRPRRARWFRTSSARGARRSVAEMRPGRSFSISPARLLGAADAPATHSRATPSPRSIVR